MKLQIVHSLLEELGLDQAALILESKAEQAAKGNWSYIEFLNRLLEEEVAVRRKRSLVTRTRLAKCRQTKHWPILILMPSPVSTYCRAFYLKFPGPGRQYSAAGTPRSRQISSGCRFNLEGTGRRPCRLFHYLKPTHE
jgi:hypothetical protein